MRLRSLLCIVMCIVSRAWAHRGVITLPLKQFILPPSDRGSFGGVQYEMWAIDGLSLGSPPQALFLTLDTGSAAAVVFLRNCTTPMCVHAVGPRFNSAVSSSFRSDGPMSGSCPLSYGAGIMQAAQDADMMALRTTNAVMNMSFAGAYSVINNPGFSPSIWEELLPSGLMGLSPFAAGCSQVNFLWQLSSAGIIEQPIAAFVYGRDGQSKGALSLGAADPTLYDDPVVWSSDFLMPIENVTINGRPAPKACGDGPKANFTCYAIPDTGGAYFSADIGFKWTIGDDCRGIDQLPALGVTLLGLTMTFSPLDYVIVTEQGPNRRKCVSGLQQLRTLPGGDFTQTSVPDAQGTWLFAGRFNTVVYNIVNMRTGMNGFALAKR